MADPAELIRQAEAKEADAEALRACARTADQQGHSVHRFMDSEKTTANDHGMWQGTFPTSVGAEISDAHADLGKISTEVGEDAAAWRKQARQLDHQADELRSEARVAKRKADADKGDQGAA